MNLFLFIVTLSGCAMTAFAFGWLAFHTIPEAKRAKARLEHTRRRKWDETSDARDLRHEIAILIFSLAEIALQVWMCYRIIKTGTL
jgi:hypothetical protein